MTAPEEPQKVKPGPPKPAPPAKAMEGGEVLPAAAAGANAAAAGANDDDDEAEEGPDENPFGAWLKQERDKKGWKRKELALKSGVTSAQIGNLETGRSLNPQEDTRKKLEAALGVSAPAAVTAEIDANAKVPGLGLLTAFDPYAKDSLPQVRGVYVLYDKTSRPVYVGKAAKRTIAVRLPEHYEKFWFRAPVVQSASYLQIDDEALCAQIEQVLIKFMKSHALLNKQYVDSDDEDTD